MPMKRCFHAEGTIFSSNRNLPDQRTIQMFLYFVRRHTMPEQEHQLGNRTFGRAVVTAHHAGLQQFATGFIAVHFHAPGKALGDIDNDDPRSTASFNISSNQLYPGAFPLPNVSITTPFKPGIFKMLSTTCGEIPGNIFKIAIFRSNK